MIYVVSGFPRSGTSMMMRCLQFAGIKPCTHRARDEVMRQHVTPEYNPNPYGHFECLPDEYSRIGFTDSIPNDHAVKIPLQQLVALGAARPATVFLMHRDPAEIIASVKRAFPKTPFERLYPRWPASYHEIVRGVREIMLDRRGVTLHDVSFAEMHRSPASVLERLPIDATAAIRGVDFSLYRNRAA